MRDERREMNAELTSTVVYGPVCAGGQRDARELPEADARLTQLIFLFLHATHESASRFFLPPCPSSSSSSALALAGPLPFPGVAPDVAPAPLMLARPRFLVDVSGPATASCEVDAVGVERRGMSL